MADDCDLESVRDFILTNGGKIRNADLVTRYRKFLDNPQSKAANREKFKDIVNTLATIKKDESGEKVLVLKKKFRTGSASMSSPSNSSSDLTRAQSEPPKQPPSPQVPRVKEREIDAMARVKSDGNLGDSSGGSNPSMETISASSVSTADSSMSAEEDDKDKENLANMSVKERAKHLNKIESQTQLEKAAGGGGRRKDNKGTNDGDEDSQSGFVTIGPKEREWLLVSSSADYHPMAKLLTHNPSLARLRDITNGYTALHWAAKHGKPEVVKMIAGSKARVNFNQRSMGGYTPLHLAAMQGHDAVIDLLVSTYKADPNIRDYTGKKAKHYLRTSASNKAQQLLLSRRQTQPPITTSISESFLRTASFRKSRSKALSSLMGSQFGPMIRKSWEGEGDGEVFDSRTTPPNSSKTSPQVRRKGSLQLAGDRSLMPPPAAPVRRKKSRSRSRDSNPEGSQFARTGSDPNLRSQAAKSTIM